MDANFKGGNRKSTHNSVAFRYISGNTHPDHDTIATFHQRFLSHLKEIVVQVLRIAHEMNILGLGEVSLDSTKVKTSASKHRALSHGLAYKLEQHLKRMYVLANYPGYMGFCLLPITEINAQTDRRLEFKQQLRELCLAENSQNKPRNNNEWMGRVCQQ